MRIVQHSSYKNNYFKDNNGAADKANIKERQRQIFLFYDYDELNQFKNVRTGKMIMINSAVVYTTRTHFTKMTSLLQFCINMYIFNIDFINGFNDKKNAICSLEQAFSNIAFNDLDRRRYTHDSQLIYISNITHDETKETLIDMESNSNYNIPDPRYYTPEHAEIVEQEETFPLNGYYQQLVYRLEELDDPGYTKIICFPFNKWESFKQQKIKELRQAECYVNDDFRMDSNMLVNDLFFTNAQNLLEGLIFGYDSQIKKVRIHKFDKNIQPTISFQKHRFPEQIVSSIDSLKDTIEHNIQSMEKIHGSMSFFYAPFNYGDQLKIYFKDYRPDNQPKLTESEYIDKIYNVDNVASEFVNNIYFD